MKRYCLCVLLALCCISVKDAHACAMLAASENDRVLIGTNEDWLDPNTSLHFVPAAGDKNGYVIYGTNRLWPETGMNDQGLVIDFLRTPYLETKNTQNKEILVGNPAAWFLETCGSVEDVLAILRTHTIGGFEQGQMMIADRNGDAAIVEGDVIHRKNGSSMIATNFLHSQVDVNECPSCIRYRIVSEMLDNLGVSVESFRQMLKAIHFEGAWGGTQYSNIYVPQDGLIHMFLFHNYEDRVTLNLHEELEKGVHSVRLADLFPRNFAYETYVESMPDGDWALIIDLFEREGPEAALDRADSLAEGVRKIQPIVEEYFDQEPVDIVGREREWSFAMVAGEHWKIRKIVGGPRTIALAVSKLAERGELDKAEGLGAAGVKRYAGNPLLLYSLGNVYIDAGNTASALSTYRALDEAFPSDNHWKTEMYDRIQAMDSSD